MKLPREVPVNEQAVDLVSCAVPPGAVERQTILETVDVGARLRFAAMRDHYGLTQAISRRTMHASCLVIAF